MEKIRILRTLAYISDSSIDIGVTTQSLEKMSFMLLSCQYQHKKKQKKTLISLLGSTKNFRLLANFFFY